MRPEISIEIHVGVEGYQRFRPHWPHEWAARVRDSLDEIVVVPAYDQGYEDGWRESAELSAKEDPIGVSA